MSSDIESAELHEDDLGTGRPRFTGKALADEGPQPRRSYASSGYSLPMDSDKAARPRRRTRRTRRLILLCLRLRPLPQRRRLQLEPTHTTKLTIHQFHRPARRLIDLRRLRHADFRADQSF